MLSCRVVVAVGSLQPGSGLQETGPGLDPESNWKATDSLQWYLPVVLLLLSCRVVVAVGSLQPGSGLQVTGRGFEIGWKIRSRRECSLRVQISMFALRHRARVVDLRGF